MGFNLVNYRMAAVLLELIGQGLTNRQIGERLLVSEKTVKNYVSMLFASLGMKRRTQVAVYAARAFPGAAPAPCVRITPGCCRSRLPGPSPAHRRPGASRRRH